MKKWSGNDRGIRFQKEICSTATSPINYQTPVG